MTTEPAADVAGMTVEEVVQMVARFADIAVEFGRNDVSGDAPMDQWGACHNEQHKLIDAVRSLAQPALDLDALRTAVVEAFDEHWDGHALPTFDAVSAVFDEWGKR